MHAQAIKRLILPQRKQIRAAVIAQYVQAAGLRGCVCFSCGHASAALIEAGLYVVEVAPDGPLRAGRWWRADEIAKAWPDLLDATSGHLGPPLLLAYGRFLKQHLGDLGPGPYQVPTGSGETFVALCMAYPDTDFWPVYGRQPHLRREARAPLDALVQALARRM